MRLVYHPLARADVIGAARYYQRQSPRLGAQLLEAVDTAVRQVTGAPERWQHLDGTVQRFVMRTFPYVVIYRVEGDTLRILAVQHSSRHPDSWRERL